MADDRVKNETNNFFCCFFSEAERILLKFPRRTVGSVIEKGALYLVILNGTFLVFFLEAVGEVAAHL